MGLGWLILVRSALRLVLCGAASHSRLRVARVAGWGGLGHGDKTQQDLPGLVERLGEDGHIVRSVSCGAKHTLALSDEGVVLAWGDGEFGRLGNGRGSAPYPEVVEELANEKCKQVSAGEAFSMALSHDGSKVRVWGRNDQSQLGLGANLTMDLNSMEEYPIQCPVPSGMSSIAQVPLIIASDMGHRDRRVPNRFHFGRPPTRVGCQ